MRSSRMKLAGVAVALYASSCNVKERPAPAVPAASRSVNQDRAAVKSPWSPTNEALDALELELDADLTPPDSLTGPALAQDLAILRFALEHAWGGQFVVPEAERSAIEAKLTEFEERSSPVANRDFCDAVADALGEVRDAHFSVGFEGQRTCGDTSWRKASVGRNIAAGHEGIWFVEERRYEELDVVIIGIKQFDDPSSPRWNGLLERLQEQESDALIIDLRGNGGGADTYAYWIGQVLGGEPLRRAGVHIERSQHPLALTMVMNMLRLRLRQLARTTRKWSDHLDADLAMLAELRDDVRRGRAPDRLAFEPAPGRDLEGEFDPYSGSVALVVDAGCGSSCENAVYLWRQLPNVVVVGENTAGAIHFGQGGRLVLPNSRAIATIATQAVVYEDGGFYEKRGFTPDVVVNPGADALDRALELVASKAERGVEPKGSDTKSSP